MAPQGQLEHRNDSIPLQGLTSCGIVLSPEEALRHLASSYLAVVICEILVVLILATSVQLGGQHCGVFARIFPEITWQSNTVSTTASFVCWCCFLWVFSVDEV